MGLFGRLVSAAEDGLEQAGQDIIAEADRAGANVGSAARKVWNAAKRNPAAAALALGPLGLIPGAAGKLGVDLFPPKKKRPPRPQDPNYTCGWDRSTGMVMAGREIFPFMSRLNVAAGAQAINTDLGDWITTAASSDLTTNNQFPFEFDADEAKVFTSSGLAASFIETLAVIAGLKVFERVNTTQELAQYSLTDLAMTHNVCGVVTSGAAAASVEVDPDGVPFEAHYTTRMGGLAMALRTIRAYTSVSAQDWTLIETGTRYAQGVGIRPGAVAR